MKHAAYLLALVIVVQFCTGCATIGAMTTSTSAASRARRLSSGWSEIRVVGLVSVIVVIKENLRSARCSAACAGEVRVILRKGPQIFCAPGDADASPGAR